MANTTTGTSVMPGLLALLRAVTAEPDDAVAPAGEGDAAPPPPAAASARCLASARKLAGPGTAFDVTTAAPVLAFTPLEATDDTAVCGTGLTTGLYAFCAGLVEDAMPAAADDESVDAVVTVLLVASTGA